MRKAVVLLLALMLPLVSMGLMKDPYSYGFNETDREGTRAFVTPSYEQQQIIRDDVVLRLYPDYPVDDPSTVSSDYGYRFLSECSRCSTSHNGVDYPLSDLNNEVYAILDGTITRVEHKGEFGLHIYIEHFIYEELVYTSVYAHLRPSDVTSSLSVGDEVVQGQHIAYIGNTGLSTGPHLHFEIHKNDTVLDPEKFFEKENLDLKSVS
jgi:murein DD-endopeptidase MepM/ murein hydrolase activator NlpD